MSKYGKVNTHTHSHTPPVPFSFGFSTDAAAACQHPLVEPQEGSVPQFCQRHGISQTSLNLSFMVTLKGSIYLQLNGWSNVPVVFWRVSVLSLAKRHAGSERRWHSTWPATAEPSTRACRGETQATPARLVTWPSPSQAPSPEDPPAQPQHASAAGPLALSTLRSTPGCRPSAPRSQFKMLSEQRSSPSLLLSSTGTNNTKHLNEGKCSRTSMGQSSDTRLVTRSIHVTN